MTSLCLRDNFHWQFVWDENNPNDDQYVEDWNEFLEEGCFRGILPSFERAVDLLHYIEGAIHSPSCPCKETWFSDGYYGYLNTRSHVALTRHEYVLILNSPSSPTAIHIPVAMDAYNYNGHGEAFTAITLEFG